MSRPDADGLLGIALSAAVPLRIMELRRMEPAARQLRITEWAALAVDVVASQGDVIQYRSKTKGATANAFNHLALGLAALAWQPGGVTFAGQHWQAID
jgi:hypothetical protein